MANKLIPSSLSNKALLAQLVSLVSQHRQTEAEIVAHMGEVDARRLYLDHSMPSMFAYSTEVLHFSEHQAYLRIAVARASRRFPLLLSMLGDGRLHLSSISKLAPHLTRENAEEVLARATHKSKREIEMLAAELAPRPDVKPSMRALPEPRGRAEGLGLDRVKDRVEAGPRGRTMNQEHPDAAPVSPPPVDPPRRPSRVQALSPKRYKVEFTASAELRDKLSRAQALLRHKVPDGDLAMVVDEALTLLIEKRERERFAAVKAPRKSVAESDTRGDARYIPAAVRRAVYARDQGRCTFVDATGKRCTCEDPGNLEYHHEQPYAKGGDHRPEGVALLCKGHNLHQAALDFGPETIDRYRRSSSEARERMPTYRLARPQKARANRSMKESAGAVVAVGGHAPLAPYLLPCSRTSAWPSKGWGPRRFAVGWATGGTVAFR